MVVKLLSRMNCIFSGMNYLAHAVLSFNSPPILVGNMISDFVKGGQKSGYTADVQKGIMLHRAIDAFTDAHPATANAKEIFRPHYRLYSAPIMDVVYDHFLAVDNTVFPNASLLPFTLQVYRTLEEQTIHLPPRFLTVLTYMKAENWLYHYHTPEGIRKSLHGLVRRATYIHDSTQAFALFLSHYDELQACFNAFFPDVKQMAKQHLDELSLNF
jgi:acyl carrier protein phosphodiesterase